MATEGPPNHPKAFGEELRRLREGAGLSIDDIAAETKISRRILKGLESGEFRFLPERVFSRNFVIQYAKVVGADSDELAAAFELAWDRFLLASGSHPMLVVEEPPPKNPISWRFWIPIGLGAGILVAAGVAIIGGSSTPERLAPDPRRGISVRPSPTAGIPSQAAAILPATGGSIEEVAELEQFVTVVVRVLPSMECWIHFRDRDGVAEQRLLAGGTETRLELLAPVKLTVGDAAAVVLEVDGVEYRDLGRPGQVVHTELSTNGLTIMGAGQRDD